jgi:anti-sigma regulatory factor (Ser/Thr protein kinase)
VGTQQPPPRSRDLRLEPVGRAAVHARLFVARTCREWGLGRLAETASLVASELVTNGVRHTRGPVVLRLEERGRGLYLGVRDNSSTPPRVGDPGRHGEGGRGLLVVEELASAWGVHQLPGGGKVVWSVLG